LNKPLEVRNAPDGRAKAELWEVRVGPIRDIRPTDSFVAPDPIAGRCSARFAAPCLRISFAF
jgi:hypothetical protein